MFKTHVTDNISLKILEENDAQTLFNMVDQSRDYLGEWLPFVAFTNTKDDTLQFIHSSLQQFVKNDGFHCGIWYNNQLVGVIGLHYIDWVNQRTSIGYYLAKNAQKQGIMTTCTQFLIDHCFNDLNLNRIEIRTSVENYKCQKIPQKLGFTHESTLRQDEKLNGKFCDSHVFSLLKSEYDSKS